MSAAVARHRAAHADRVALVGGVAHVDRRPQFVRVQQRAFARARPGARRRAEPRRAEDGAAPASGASGPRRSIVRERLPATMQVKIAPAEAPGAAVVVSPDDGGE